MTFQRRALFPLIFLSGVSGLIYQIVWQRYLSILLGAHARATAIVLAIFLGGLAGGYAYFGRWSKETKRDLVKTYAVIEFLLGVWALLFPVLFSLAMGLTGFLYKHLGVTNILTDLIISALLIGPPTFLMGSTLPLLTQGMSRNLHEASRIHARVYGYNTVGACLGSLLAGYYLIPEKSFQWALAVGALINFLVGFLLWTFRAVDKEVHKERETVARTATHSQVYIPILMAIGFCSGLSIITLENVVIRLIGLAGGASHYNFTLVVSIFIFGLGIGSLLVRKIRNYSEARLLWNVLLISFTWSILFLLGRFWPYHVHVIRASLADVTQGFYGYQIALGLYFLLVLLIPVSIAGLTLPICFHLMKDNANTLGYRVGQLYSLNTVGCVLGAVIGGHLLLYWFDLDQVFRLCVLLMLGASFLALKLYLIRFRPSQLRMLSLIFMFAVPTGIALFAKPYPREIWIQPFRNQEQLESTLKGEVAFRNFLSRSTNMVFWKDGPNTSLGIGTTPKEGAEESRSIFVNGKSDGNTRGDYFTTVMLGHIPALLSGRIENAAVIGFGTGITIGTLAQYSELKKIEVLEIADTIVNNAFRFDAYNGGVSKHPKVEFHVMDAFRYFEGTRSNFDLIVSEPSNPWVMGIENLYSKEFYNLAKRKLSDNGIFAQWIHTYSFSDDLLKMVLKTITSEFPHVSMYQLKGGDLALIARKTPMDSEVYGRIIQRMAQREVQLSLRSAGILSIESLLALEIIPEETLLTMAAGGREHYLTSPKLSHESARAFFLRTSATPLTTRRSFKKWNATVGNSLLTQYLGEMGYTKSALQGLRHTFCDHTPSKNTVLCEEAVFASRFYDGQFRPLNGYGDVLPARVLATVDSGIVEKTKPFQEADITEIYNLYESYKKYVSPVTRIPTRFLFRRLDQCLRETSRQRSLYGQCLLQKLLMMDSLELEKSSFDDLSAQYIKWFESVPTNSSDYLKLKEAKEILERMRSKS